MRDRYLRQLKIVHNELLRMGSRVEHSLANSMRALATWDTTLAQQVIADDQFIDAARDGLEESVYTLLATQQPVLGTDLRTLSATIAIANELERAGDYSKGIAKRVIRCLRASNLIETPSKLYLMGEIAQQMLRISLDAFVRLDVNMARSLADEDEKVDELENQVTTELLDATRLDPSRLDCTICLLDVAHTLERLADRATNIAERVIFVATTANEALNR